MRYLLVAAMAGFSLVACKNAAQPDKVEYSKDSTYGITYKEQGDTTFERLMKLAQAELPAFVDSLEKSAQKEGYSFMVKSAFTDGENTEHMWSTVSRFEKDEFKGMLIDSAFNLKNVHTGQPVTIKKNEVEDWIIMDELNGKQYGYFSESFLMGQ